MQQGIQRTVTISRRGKVLIFKPKSPSFHTTEFSYINIFSWKTDQIFNLWVDQSLKLRRNTCLRGFKSSLVFQITKPERLALSKNWTSIFCLSKGTQCQQVLANPLEGFEYYFRCLKWFFKKLPRKLQSAFFENTAFGHVTEVPTHIISE